MIPRNLLFFFINVSESNVWAVCIALDDGIPRRRLLPVNGIYDFSEYNIMAKIFGL